MQDVKTDRWKYIGGSDIPVIMGLVNYGKTRWDLLLEKAQLWSDDFDGNVYTEYGQVMEESIRNYINFQYSTEFKEDVVIQGEDLRYHADGYDYNADAVLEIKTTGKIYDNPRDYKAYLVQLLFGMDLYDVDDGLLAVYLRPDDMSTVFDADRLSLFPIVKTDYEDILMEVVKAVEDFICDMYYLREHLTATEDELPTRTMLVPLATQVANLERTMEQYKLVEKEYKTLKAKLKTAMENAGVKTWTLHGGTRITLVPDGEDKMVDTFDEKLFAEENPELYETYTTKKLSKGKAGYVRITLAKGE